MSAGSPKNQKCYIDRGVQTASPKISDNSTALELAQENSLSLLEDLESSAIVAEELSYTSSAYMRLSPQSSPLLTATERSFKPQLPVNRPSHSNRESARVVSLPETAPLFSGKRALKSTARIVSMPGQGSSSSYMLDNSVSSLDRMDVSVLTGDSYTSLEDENSGIRLSRRRQGIPHTPSPPSSPDSVLIIEHNGELSEAFLRKKCSETDESSDSAPEPTGHDEGWISWAKSPPRPIPALHGPLSLPYARCPSGAEGTIIEGPGDLPRMIWGLESDEHAPPQSQSGSEDAGPPPTEKLASVSQSPVQLMPLKPQQERPMGRAQKSQPQPTASVQSTQARDSVDRGKESVQRAEEHVTAEERYPRGLFDDAIVLENLVQDSGTARTFRASGNNLVNSVLSDTSVLRQIDSDYDARQQFNAARIQPRRLSVNNTLRTGHAAGSIPAEAFPSSGRMRVTTRPALGSALPQILIEPRSPENLQIPPRRSSAMEIAQQYRQQIQRQHGNLLPTPPNSSSPLWSSDFSPYQDSLLSPNLTSHLSGPLSLSPNQILKSLVSSNQSRQQFLDNVNDFGYDLGFVPSLAPPAQISSSARLQVPVNNGSNVFIPQSSKNYVSDRQHGLSPASAPVASSRPPPNIPATVERRNVYPQSLIQAPLSPTSPENFRTRGSSQHQPRSIPLARLMQRRLSAVPEEDLVSPARRSPVSSAASGNPGLPRTNYRASNASSHFNVDSQITYPMSAIQLQAKARGSANAAATQQGLATQSRVPDYSLGELYVEPATVDAEARVRLPSLSRSRSGNGRRDEGSRYELAGRGRQESERGEQRDKEGIGRSSMGRKKMRGRSRKPFAGAVNR